MPFFNAFFEFVTILLLLFIFCFFGFKACGIIAPPPGMEPETSVLEGEVLTTGLPGGSHDFALLLSVPLVFH